MTRDRQAGSMESRPSVSDMGHIPVLCAEVVHCFTPAAGGLLVDCTLGTGGHAEVLLSELTPPVSLLGIEKDERAVEVATTRLAKFGDRVEIVRSDFEDLEAVFSELGKASADGVLFDLGVSSLQLDSSERGFSYRHKGPLDMRMSRESREISAYEVVNEYEGPALENVIRAFGEEPFASSIAEAIVSARPISTTEELASVVRGAIPAARRRSGGHPARRTFQAIRIEVNQELRRIRSALQQSVEILTSPGGRLVVISYHSLEDRIVKQFIREMSRECECPPRLPKCACKRRPLMRPVSRRPIRPTQAEVQRNRRARSARLRCAERSDVSLEGVSSHE